MRENRLQLSLIGLVLLHLIACNTSPTDNRDDITELVVNESEMEIVATVERFWEASLAGDDRALAATISDPPERFFQTVPPPQNQIRDSKASKPVGAGFGPSSSVRKGMRIGLSTFSDDIRSRKGRLIWVGVIRRNDSDAIVKIEFGRHDAGTGVVMRGFLCKDDGTWRIFMIGDPEEDYLNPRFGEP